MRLTISVDGYLLAPGGCHPDGLVYEFENVEIEKENGRPPAISDTLYDLLIQLGKHGRDGVGDVVDGGEPISVGDRHIAMRHLAGRLRGEGLGGRVIEAALEELSERFVEPLEDRRELTQVVNWILSKPAPPPIHPVDLELLAVLDRLPVKITGRQRRARRAVGWEQPVPLRSRSPVPSFPLDVLPTWLREWAVAIAHEKGACVDAAVNLSIGVIAGALARHVVVMPRPGWTEPINVYIVTALDPGQRKTPLYKAALRPVRALERRRILEWDEKAALTRILVSIIEKRRKEMIADAADDDDLTPELLRERVAAITDGLGDTEVTPRPRLLTEDVTPEGLAMLLAEHGRIIAASDEGAILFENFSGHYTQGSPNWDLLNKAHSAGDLVVDRKSTGTVFVWDPALTLVLATQPRVLRDLWGSLALLRAVCSRAPSIASPTPCTKPAAHRQQASTSLPTTNGAFALCMRTCPCR